MTQLEGKVALVTGAGSGIGRANAQVMASRGATLIVNDQHEALAAETVALIIAAGGRAITFVGINADGDLITETVATAGASASAATDQTFIRLREAFVSASGTYATQAAGSHASTINIEDTAGNLWATIADGSLGRGNTEQAVFTTPKNRAALVTNVFLSSDADKKANIVFYQRQGILKTSAPYDALQIINEFPQNAGLSDLAFNPPIYFPPLTDFGFLASVSASTVDVSIGIDLIEVIPT